MAELDDLKNAVAALTQAVTDAATEMKAVADALVALQQKQVINPADVEAIAVQASALATTLNDSVAATKAEAGV